MNKLWKLCVCLILTAGLLIGCSQADDVTRAHLVTPSGKAVSIGDDGADIQSVLGSPEAYVEAQSCYGNGFDKVYTYSGFEITTYPSQDGKQELVSVIVLTNNMVETGMGLKVGQPFSAVTEIYGESYIERGASRVYTLEEDVTLWVDIEEDLITRIEFRAP